MRRRLGGFAERGGNGPERGACFDTQSTDVARRGPSGARPGCTVRERCRFALQPRDDGLDLRACFPYLLRDFARCPAASSGTASRSASRASRPCSASRSRRTAARSSAAASFSRSASPRYLIDLLEVRGELRLAARAAGSGVGDHRGGQCPGARRSPARGSARARHTGVCTLGRPVSGLKPNAARRRAGRRRRVRLQCVGVRRGHDERAALLKMIDDGSAQRAALDGVGPAAHLVEQHERRLFEPALDCHEVRHMRGERAQARRDRLLVADVRKDRPEGRERAPFVDGDEQSGLSHQREQAEGLERDGLAAGVRPGDDERARRRHQHEVGRDHDGARLAPESSDGGRGTAGIRSGCRAPRNSIRPSVTSAGAMPSTRPASRPLASASSRRAAAPGERVELVAPHAERRGQRQQNAVDFLYFSRSARATTSLFKSTVESGST